MVTFRNLCKVLAWTAACVFLLSIAAVGCRPPFPQCRSDDDCKAEKGNSTLLVCVNGQCQECAKDADCPKERPKCKDARCVECLEDKDCPEGKLCKDNQCKYECEIDSDCQDGKICKEHKCRFECEKDEDCPAGNECKDHRCVVKCKCQSDQDCPEGKMCQSCDCTDRPQCQPQAIHFDFNRYDLRSEDRQTLDKNAECMKQRPDLKVTVEGHCDDRGTEEYNITLGDKRARAAKNYMERLGIGAKRLGSISYGEGRPVCREQSEDCWGQNRRDEFVEK
jgi:peptidoglycan-associated lipoprotein